MVPLREYVAELMWKAYCRAVGGKAFNGEILPTWQMMVNDPSKKLQVEGWLSAADAAIEDLQD
jgi:hypothetical protein